MTQKKNQTTSKKFFSKKNALGLAKKLEKDNRQPTVKTMGKVTKVTYLKNNSANRRDHGVITSIEDYDPSEDYNPTSSNSCDDYDYDYGMIPDEDGDLISPEYHPDNFEKSLDELF